MRNALLLAIALLAGSFCSTARAQMTKLRVEVKNMDGKPVDNASVLVRFVEGRSAVKFGKKIKTSWEMKTNQDGVVGIPPIPQGKILVQVIAKAYQTYGDTIEVNEEEKTVEIKLKPPQSQYSAHQ
jgi:uncharacterized GH25 family protein